MKKLFFALMALAILAGCNDRGADYVEDLDITLTRYNPEYNFGDGIHYYVMSDTIIHIIDGKENDEVERKWDETILSQIQLNLTNQGYEKVDLDPETYTPGDVDFIVTVSAISSKQYGYYWWGYPSWGYFPGWGWPDWGYPGYPGYPGWGYPLTYSYRVGTLVVEFADVKNPVKGDEGDIIYPVFFYGGVNGLLKGSDSYIATRLETGINDMFKQSPF